MNSISLPNYFTAEGINQTALKDYKTYLQHYALKNLQPMAFEEFLRNYRTSA
jgi:hypothetical protein